SRAPGTYDVYWKMSPVSFRVGRWRMTRASTLPRGPELLSPPQPNPSRAAPIAMLAFFIMVARTVTRTEPAKPAEISGVHVGAPAPDSRASGASAPDYM